MSAESPPAGPGAPAADRFAAGAGVADSSQAAPADSSEAPAPHVGRVFVQGNVSADSLRIVRTFEVFPGSLYSDDAVRRGLRKLYALGVFEDISLDRDEHDAVVDITIHVRERPHISKFVFVGNRHKDTAELEKKLFLRPGAAYSPTALQTQVDSLLKFYRDDGYAQVAIRVSPDTLPERQVAVKFDISEGEKVKITRIELVGVHQFDEHHLHKEMKTKPHSFMGGGDVKDENFEEDREKIEAWYHSHGFRDARVTGHELRPGGTPRHLTYVVTIEEGERYHFGKVSWTGAQVIPQLELSRMWHAREGELYDVSRIEKAQGEIYAVYAERGYLYLNVEPRETVRDSLVDIAFTIGEGQPSHVRMVNVVGNHGTREKVVRRQLAIHEGDQFRRSALVRTQGDVFRLGIFEDVQMDFSPAESTDVDINVKVKEKQVGTASAGAGYTSQSGLTGFLELGHSNVLGNAQALQLHLERGARTSDYFVNFTEPWFHDTPTLLGFSVFKSALVRDFYHEKHLGGSAQIGRPLRHPDFSHVTFTYRLENVTYDSLNTLTARTVTDSITLQDINPGVPRLTSSLSISFNRNTTDNPFYPTRGTRFLYVPQFTGGPFGGTIEFHKHRIDGRVYLPSLTRGLTTMLRARIGLLGEYGRQNDTHVPAYERFRLGGGSTLDPLRGYDDYQVVPDKFNRIVIERFAVGKDTVGGVIGTKYRFVPVHVRYPGGRYFTTYTMEQQFPVVNPLHGVIFFDAGNTWDLGHEIQPFNLKVGAGIGFRLEIPVLGNIGFDYGYGFNRDDRPKWVGHFLLGNVNN
ncbi:MAG: outer membrane protein assembly factor BamA [Candidatus Eisenbacteria bacterium]|nr:outer membrane protein assembly factor BamA [Candidatus Eisenbacteria bacterium]